MWEKGVKEREILVTVVEAQQDCKMAPYLLILVMNYTIDMLQVELKMIYLLAWLKRNQFGSKRDFLLSFPESDFFEALRSHPPFI